MNKKNKMNRHKDMGALNENEGLAIDINKLTKGFSKYEMHIATH